MLRNYFKLMLVLTLINLYARATDCTAEYRRCQSIQEELEMLDSPMEDCEAQLYECESQEEQYFDEDMTQGLEDASDPLGEFLANETEEEYEN